MKHIMAILISIFSLGYHAKTIDFEKYSPCHRTTVAHFLKKGNGTMTGWMTQSKVPLSNLSSIGKPSRPEILCSALWMTPSLLRQSLRHRLCIRLKMCISTSPILRGSRTMDIRLWQSCSPVTALFLTMPSSCTISPGRK